jgi:hypothetical protein
MVVLVSTRKLLGIEAVASLLRDTAGESKRIKLEGIIYKREM